MDNLDIWINKSITVLKVLNKSLFIRFFSISTETKRAHAWDASFQALTKIDLGPVGSTLVPLSTFPCLDKYLI